MGIVEEEIHRALETTLEPGLRSLPEIRAWKVSRKGRSGAHPDVRNRMTSVEKKLENNLEIPQNGKQRTTI